MTASHPVTGPAVPRRQAAPFWVLLLLTGLLIALMGYISLVLFPGKVVALTYGLPLLVCLWHRDLRLLYAMALCYSVMVGFKAVSLSAAAASQGTYDPWIAGGMMLVNIWTITGVVHALVRFSNDLERRNAELEATNTTLELTNAELAAREEEISRQNEELQAQTEELEQQAEEMRQQAEEMEQQGAEVQAINDELSRRERALQTLLDSARWLRSDVAEQDVMAAICQAAVEVMSDDVTAAAIVQEHEGRFHLRGQWGFGIHGRLKHEFDFARSFASLVVDRRQTAYLEDFAARPDLVAPHPAVGRPFRSVLAPPLWAEGRVIGVVEIYSPKPRKWTEEEFRVIEWLAAQVAMTLQSIEFQRELIQKRREAEEGSLQKTRFLAAVSHDVRTPANAISLMADLIERAADDPGQLPELPEMVRSLKSSARALVELVSDVLDLARFDAGRFDLQVSDFNLVSLIRAEVQQFEPMAESKGLSLSAAVPSEPVWLRTDKMKLARVLANLVGNAVKFTDVGEVEVGLCSRADGGLELFVRDTGVGISAEQLPRIFDEFHQLRNPERDRNKGTGLGLAICQRLVEGLGCSVDVESTPDVGTTFRVNIPSDLVIRSGEAPSTREMPPIPRPEEANDAFLEGVEVLLVEDHLPTRQTMERLLEAGGARVHSASTCRDAIHLLAHERPDVLLLDLMLPDGDGSEVLRSLRGRRPPSLRCILAISGDVREARVEEARRLGASDLLPKPVTTESLMEALRAHLPDRRRRRGAATSVGEEV